MIFLHSGFRTGSTFVWSCFRRAPRTVAYYEIFNDALATLTTGDLAGLRQDVWNSKHPAGAPYFLEFLPLIDGVGVAGFESAMSYERFVPAQGCGGPVSELEIRYGRGLITHAEDRGRIPVLTSTRSLGRVRGFKQALPGLHILLYRNVFQQWCSFTGQAVGGNNYFLDRIAETVRLNLHDRTLRELNALFPTEKPSHDDPATFFMFLFLHLHVYTQSAGGADVVMDLNRLAADRSYRLDIERQMAAQDVPIDLSGVGNSIAYSLCTFGSQAELLERLKVVGGMVIDRAPDAAGRAFGSKVLDEFTEEHLRYEFYATGLRSILLGQKNVLTERDASRQQTAAVQAGPTMQRELLGSDEKPPVLMPPVLMPPVLMPPVLMPPVLKLISARDVEHEKGNGKSGKRRRRKKK